MARQPSEAACGASSAAGVDEALRRAASGVACDGDGRWRFSVMNGAPVPAAARLTSGWLELTMPLSSWAPPEYDDVQALRLNPSLPGSIRVARPFGRRQPRVLADACIEHVPDLTAWVGAACAGLTEAAHSIAGRQQRLLREASTSVPAATLADVERACRETGWPIVATSGSNLRVDIATRVGVFAARHESSATADHFVVELMDLTGCSDVCRRAVASLLTAVSDSIRLVKGGLVDAGVSSSAVLMSSLDGPSERSVDDALSALAVACLASGREAQALVDERLASEYLALSRGVVEETADSSMEVETCLQ